MESSATPSITDNQKQILIIQENGHHERNRRFRECFSLQRAFHHLGISAHVWGLGHANYHDAFDNLICHFDAVISLENYDTGWHPDLSSVSIPKIFWCIDAHMGIEKYLDFVRRNRFDIVFNATEYFVDHFRGLAHSSLWLPNAYDSFLVDKMFGIRKQVPLGFCGNRINRGKWIEHLKQRWNLKHDEMVIGPDMVRAVNGYQIHWNRNVSGDINYRTFETLGCQTFLLTNPSPGLEKLFTPGKHLAVYETQEELDEKITYYLEHAEERERIARQGYYHVRQHHRYIHRAERILDTIGFKIPNRIRLNYQIPIYDITERMISSKRYLFVSGATKSGTTLLASALGLSEKISFLTNIHGKQEEGQWVQDVYKWGNGNNGLREAYHMTEKHPLAYVDNRIRLFRLWSRFWDLSKPILAEKSPHNIIKTRFLQALFPDSKFLILVRNGIVQVTGEALQEKRSPLICCREWVRAYQMLIRDLPCLHEYHIVRYEDMTNDIEATFDRICRFINIPTVKIEDRLFHVHTFLNGVQRSENNPIRDMNRPHIENFINRFDSQTQHEMLCICAPIMKTFYYTTEISKYHEYLETRNHQSLLTRAALSAFSA